MFSFRVFRCLAIVAFPLGICVTTFGDTVELGNGFYDHGPASQISSGRGVVAAVNGQGKNVALIWLFDSRGTYALLEVDTETGQSKQHPLPLPPYGQAPFASIFSSKQKLYTHFAGQFFEFDPELGKFTFFQRSTRRMACSFTEDQTGKIWAALYPNCNLLSFNPETRELVDHGAINRESPNWSQYPETIAVDETGWVYIGIGPKSSQVAAFNPASGEKKSLIPDGERINGHSYVYRNTNGKVYGFSGKAPRNNWFEFYQGTRKLTGRHNPSGKRIITGDQSIFYGDFPDGRQLVEVNLTERKMVVANQVGQKSDVRFDYESEGPRILGAAVAPNGTISGGTMFPMRYFSYDPATDQWKGDFCAGQWNCAVTQGDRFFVGGYGNGILLEWDPFLPWVATKTGNPRSNPLLLTLAKPAIHRTHALLGHSDGRTIVSGGTPPPGATGGGLMFWDRVTRSRTLVAHNNIVPSQSVMSLASLNPNDIIGGTTVSAGSGGATTASTAEIFLFDIRKKTLRWRQSFLEGTKQYTDLHVNPDNLVYGIADRRYFFVLDANRRELLHQRDLKPDFGMTVTQQGPVAFVDGPQNETYILLLKGIVKVDPQSFELSMIARSPVAIEAGGVYFNGRIYFANRSRLYSYQLE